MGMNAHRADWSNLTLDQVSVEIQDGTHFSPKPGGSEYPYITSRNIGHGHLRLNSVEMISEDEHRKIYRHCSPRYGDLLLTKDGANTGNAAINTFSDEISLLSSVAFIRANHALATERYILQYILSGPGRKQVVNAMAGNAITRLTLAKIKALRVPLPSVDEQRAITSALSDTDDLITSLESLLAKKRDIKQAVMQRLLTGRNRLPGFEGDWEMVPIGSLGTIYGGLSGKSKSDFDTGEARYIRFLDVVSNVEAGRGLLPKVNVGPIESQNSVARGDLLFNGSSETPDELALCAVAGEVPNRTYLNSFCFGLRPDSERDDSPLFLAYLFRSSVGRQRITALAQGSTRYNIAKSRFRKLMVPCPAPDEQHAIAAVLSDIDTEIEALESRLEKTRDIKVGMMQELLTGRTRLPVPESNHEERVDGDTSAEGRDPELSGDESSGLDELEGALA